MKKIKPRSLAFVFAIFLGGWHALWALLIWLGIAQPLLDGVFKLHMVQPVFVVDTFSIGHAVSLILVATVAGYGIGWIVAKIWDVSIA